MGEEAIIFLDETAVKFVHWAIFYLTAFTVMSPYGRGANP